MKKILVIGNTNSIFVRDFCLQISNNECIVDVLSIDGTADVIQARKIYSINKTEKIPKEKYSRFIFLQIKIANAINKFDSDYNCIVIHSVDARLSFFINKILKKTNRLVTVVWGSDFYRASNLIKSLQKIIYKKSTSIVFTNPVTANSFKESKSNSTATPLRIARFGLPALDAIKKIQQLNLSRSELCEFFEIPQDKIIILAGYNASLTQKQELIINEFSKIDEKIRNKSFIVFPLGYGDPTASIKIQSLLKANKICNFKILDKFYDFQDIAKLRCITDILINIQPSDQLSGSMCETIFAGGRIIAGNWLPYKEIIEKGAPIRTIESPEEIGAAIKSEIEFGISRSTIGQEEIISHIKNIASWESNLKVWNHIMFD